MEIPYTVNARADTGLYNAKLGVWLFLASEVMLFGALFTSYIMMRLNAGPGEWPSHVLNVGLGFLNTFLLVCSSITMVYAWVSLKERKLAAFRLWTLATIALAVVFLCIKADEYYDKGQHWGFFLKDDVYQQKYEPEISARSAYSNTLPDQGVTEIRGHLHGFEYANPDPDHPDDPRKVVAYIIKPDPIFVPEASYLKSIFEKPAQPEKGGEGAEPTETIRVLKSDTVRASNFLPQYNTYFAIYFTITGLHALHIMAGIVIMLYFVGPGVRIYRRNPEHMANRIEVFGIFWHFVDLVWITAFPILYLL